MSEGTRSDESENESPGKDQSERLKDARTAVLEGLADALGNLHRLNAIAGEGRGPELPRLLVGQGTSDGDLLLDLVRLQLDITNRLLAFGRDHADFFMNRLSKARAPRAGTPLQALRLSGPADGEAASRFVLENGSRSEVVITVRASALEGLDCGPPFEGPVRVTPADVRLGPGQEAEVEVRLALDRPRFAPRQRYRGGIEVISPNHPRRVIPLWIEVLEPAARPEP